MSRKFNSKNKSLISLKVVSASEVWEHDGKGGYRMKKNLNVFGKIEKGTSAFISTTNMRGTNHRFIDDVCNLPANLKNQIIKNFKDDKKKVIYLIRD